jgi:HK97 family phage major capsid protein
MNRLKEIEVRKNEIKASLNTLEDIEEIKKLDEEVEELIVEEKEIKEAEKRKKIADKLEEKSLEAKAIEKEEEKEMEKKFDLKSPEYRTAWAKSMMGLELDETDKRAIGDAVGTTATEFVASAANANGINNLGLLIPESLRMDLMKIAEEQSPFYRDITKLNINGNIDLPYLFAADDAEWYAETTTTKNEGQEYKNLKLTGHELSKAIEITWKAESMTVDGFMDFLLKELNKKMNTALITASIYGTGSNQPTGATNGLTAKEDSNVIDLIKTCLGTLSNEDRVGAKVYVANNVADSIAFYKDANGNYPYLTAKLGIAGGATIEADPYLKSNDILVGNASNYIMNFNETLRIDKEVKVQPRRVVYGGYLIADGQAKPNAFVLGKIVAQTTTKTTDK